MSCSNELILNVSLRLPGGLSEIVCGAFTIHVDRGFSCSTEIARSRAVHAKSRSVVSVAVPEPLLFGTWVTWRRLKRCSSR